jgi:hypothetical protein
MPTPARLIGAIAIASTIVAAGCGSSSPSTPSSSSSSALVGAWTGTWTYVSAGLTLTETVTATVTASSLTWQSESGASGSLQLTGEGASFSGNASIMQTAVGLSCTGAGTANGTSTANSISFDIPSFTSSGCQWSTNNHFVLKRN